MGWDGACGKTALSNSDRHITALANVFTGNPGSTSPLRLTLPLPLSGVFSTDLWTDFVSLALN